MTNLDINTEFLWQTADAWFVYCFLRGGAFAHLTNTVSPRYTPFLSGSYLAVAPV